LFCFLAERSVSILVFALKTPLATADNSKGLLRIRGPLAFYEES
jgi:hypothetical protein